MSIEKNSLIEVEMTKKDKFFHHILTLSNANIDYLCAQHANNSRLIGMSQKNTTFDIVLNPNGDIPEKIFSASFSKNYLIPLSVPKTNGTYSREDMLEAIKKYQEIPIEFKFKSMIVGYVSLRMKG